MTRFSLKQRELSVDSLRQIEAVCSRFERSPPADRRPIERFLAGTDGEHRALLLLELIALDIELRREQGEPAATQEYDRLWDAIGRRPESVNSGVIRPDFWRSFLPPPPETSLPPPSRRYRFLKRVGRGGIGDVWRAYDTHGQRTVAVKLLRSRHRGDADAESRFRREAQLTGTLQHPGIPPIYDHGQLDDGTTFLSMRLVEGQTLAHLLKDRSPGPRDLSGLLGTFEQVARTIAYVHTEAVVHRDLKPQNVMVGRFGEVQVMDWGLAKRLDTPDGQAPDRAAGSTPHDERHDRDGRRHRDGRDGRDDHRIALGRADDSSLTRAGDIVGTPNCMAPEQARGDLHLIDARADVFGLGAILFEILTRHGLHDGLEPDEAMRRLALGDLGDSLERLRDAGHDAELTGLCEDCLRAIPDQRPTDAGQVASRISGYLAGVARRLREAEFDRSAAVIRAGEEGKRRRMIAQFASLVTLVSLIGIAAVAWQWNRAVESSRNAIAARRLADERFRQAQQVVQEYLTEVAENDGVLARTPGTQTLRRALLEKARDYYDQFLSESGGDPSLRFETAAAYSRLGEITHILDPGGEDVFALYGSAIEIYQQLVDDARNEDTAADQTGAKDAIRAAEGLAEAHAAIGDAHLSGNAQEQAETAYAAAAEVFTALVAEHAREKDQLSLATMTHNIALTRADRGQKRAAETLFLDAVRLAEPLLETLGDDPESLFAIANIFSGTGVHYGFKLGDWKASLDYGQRGVEMRSRLVERAPGRHRYENALAGSHNNVALALYHNGRPDDAHDSFLRAAKLRERLARENPAIPEYAWFLGNIYNNLGTMSAKRDGGRESVGYYQKALTLKRRVFLDHPQVLKYGEDTLNLLTSLATIDPYHPRTAGLIREAIELYGELRTQRPDSQAYAANLALYRLVAVTTAEPFAAAFASVHADDDDDDDPDDDPDDGDEGLGQLLELTAACGPGHSGVSPRHRAIRGLVLCRAGQGDAAAAAVDAIPADDRDPLGWLAACKAQLATGDLAAARESLRHAAERIDKNPFPDIEWVVFRAEAEQEMEAAQATQAAETGDDYTKRGLTLCGLVDEFVPREGRPPFRIPGNDR